ncbi:hypothetical protein KXD40_003352 [Peronospora effusa]|uniref:Uncharacterized protein n=1 Tax=Peronospora effusa TaxID=542832 RepID=A0A3M6V8N1_9STRA|nr:hypothetical protein DD238_007757 [Peronospora effusa]RQM12515.1 hypothetical protein DD237_007797 [Peronospora effusa]UIZ29367.1 hypothetical protein KXD40_003352 [Peronospora effusa]
MRLQIPTLALALFAATTSANNLQTPSHRGLKAESLDFLSYKCKCKSKIRKCLFIHGELHSKHHDDLQDKSDYFGDMKHHAPCCSTIKYVSLDTETVGWTDEDLQETVCKHALSMSDKSDHKKKVIKDTILVTYSMGAPILAGAVANKKCKIEKKSTSWVSMSAPMLGSMAVDTALNVCSNDKPRTFQAAMLLLGKCPVKAGLKSLAFMGGHYSSKELNTAYEDAQDVYRKYVTAAMCSNSFEGLISGDQIKYAGLATFAGHQSKKNDGFVTFESCRGGLDAEKFHDDPTSAFYVSKCNHADTKFQHMDDLFKKSKKPKRWFECAL